MKHSPDATAPGVGAAPRQPSRRGFTLPELMIVTVIMGLLASLAIPGFDGVRQKAYDKAALADLHSADHAIELFWNKYNRYPNTATELFTEGYVHTDGVSFTKFSVRDKLDPANVRVHMHIEHEASVRYYHFEYPTGGIPEHRWKK